MRDDLPQLLVACFCADWCGTCREYRPGFEALGEARPDASFHWIDIEDDADWAGHFEVETFPTVLIQHGDAVLYYGPTLPQHTHLLRTLETLAALGDDERARYVNASEERRGWQDEYDLRAALSRRR